MSQPKKILWIEDLPGVWVKKFIERLYKSFDVLVLLVRNDEDATIALKISEFDLVITDMGMLPAGGKSIVSAKTNPMRVGLELLKHLRAGDLLTGTRKDVPVIVFSNLVDITNKEKTRDLKPAPIAYLEKPISFSDFKEVLGKALIS